MDDKYSRFSGKIDKYLFIIYELDVHISPAKKIQCLRVLAMLSVLKKYSVCPSRTEKAATKSPVAYLPCNALKVRTCVILRVTPK